MAIAISEDHLELAGVAAAFLERTAARAEARALLDAPDESLPASWKEMADLGWLGLHLPETHGGSGFGFAELVVVLEALGAAIAPGPFLPTVWASAVIAAAGTDPQQAAHLPGLADGSSAARWDSTSAPDLVLGAGLADLFLLPRGDDLVTRDTRRSHGHGTGQHGRHPTRRHRDPHRHARSGPRPHRRARDGRHPRSPPRSRGGDRRCTGLRRPWPASTPRCASSSDASSGCSRR